MASIEEARKAFERYDVDGDGYITAAEYKHVMAQLGDFYAGAAAESVIAQRDGNGDKKLSFDEFWAGLNKS